MLHLLFHTPPGARVVDLSPAGVASRLAAGLPVIDIRRAEEWEGTGVIPGSHLLTFFDEFRRYDLPGWLADFDRVADRRQPFVLVCRNGVRTRRLGRYLNGALGWPSVEHAAGGVSAWLAAGLELGLAPEPPATP